MVRDGASEVIRVDVDAGTGAGEGVGGGCVTALDVDCMGCTVCTLDMLFCVNAASLVVEAVGCTTCTLSEPFWVDATALDVEVVGCTIRTSNELFGVDGMVGLIAKFDACRFGSGSIAEDEEISGLGRFNALKISRARCDVSACLGVRLGVGVWFGIRARGVLVGGGCCSSADEGGGRGSTCGGTGWEGSGCITVVLFLVALAAICAPIGCDSRE